ncbi:MAG: molybdenum cofactor biosynthesis protein MoaE [Planctomycetales bacterium]|nr:molybdenum cofactor biosynthesis protein MoaE [Planctomycetales bacterium]
MVELTYDPIDTDSILSSFHDTTAGAVVLFVGNTRELTAGRRTDRLEYECYPEMAMAKLQELSESASQRWPIVRWHVVHRLGVVPPGQASVVVAISTPHRRDAFDAAQWYMDRLKEQVPIWKKENWSDGTSEWVHPGA